MEVEYDTSETSFRKFMALGVIQSILGMATIGMSIAYLPAAGALGLIKDGGSLSVPFVLVQLVFGVMLTAELILALRIRKNAASISRNAFLFLGANGFNFVAAIIMIGLSTALITELWSGNAGWSVMRYPVACMIASGIEMWLSLVTVMTLLFRFPARVGSKMEYFSDLIMF